MRSQMYDEGTEGWWSAHQHKLTLQKDNFNSFQGYSVGHAQVHILTGLAPFFGFWFRGFPRSRLIACSDPANYRYLLGYRAELRPTTLNPRQRFSSEPESNIWTTLQIGYCHSSCTLTESTHLTLLQGWLLGAAIAAGAEGLMRGLAVEMKPKQVNLAQASTFPVNIGFKLLSGEFEWFSWAAP